MLRFIFLLSAFLLSASLVLRAAPTLTLTGATTTQAIILVTTTSPSSCSIVVSESNTLSPPVPDVDTGVVSGSNLAGRTGNVVLSGSVVFVVGRKFTDPTSGKSLALHANSQHYAQVTCTDGTSSTLNFQTGNIVTGNLYGDPLLAHPSTAGAFNWPTTCSSSSSRGSRCIDPYTGLAVYSLYKASDYANTSLSIYPSLVNSGVNLCSGPVTVAGNLGQYCALTWFNTWGWYFISESDPTLNKLLAIGTVTAVAADAGSTAQMSFGNGSPFGDPANPLHVMGQTDARQGVIVSGVIDHSDDIDHTGLDLIPSSNITWTNVLPHARSLLVLSNEFDTGFDNTKIPSIYTAHYANNVISFAAATTQGKAGWFGVFDPNRTAAQQTTAFGSAAGCKNNSAVTGSTYAGQPGCVIALVSSYAGPAGSRIIGGEVHQVGSPDIPGWLDLSSNTASCCTLTTASTLVDSAGGACPSQPGGSPIPAAEWPGGGAKCDTVDVTTLTYAANYNPDSLVLGTVKIGSLFSLGVNGPVNQSVVRVLTISGTTLTIQRELQSGYNAGLASGGTMYLQTGATNYAFPQGAINTPIWWDYANCPKASVCAGTPPSGFSPVVGGSHVGYGQTSGVGNGWLFSLFGSQPAIPPTALANSTFYDFAPWSLFTGYTPIPGVNTCSGGGNDLCDWDSHPGYGRHGSSIDGTLDLGGDTGTASLVGGTTQVYVISKAVASATLKTVPLAVHAQVHPTVDISGPVSCGSPCMITDGSGGAYKDCRVYNAGECWSGSSVGEIYLNTPTPEITTCASKGYHGAGVVTKDICVSFMNGNKNSLLQSDLSHASTKGEYQRGLTSAFMAYQSDALVPYWQASTVESGHWGMANFGTGIEDVGPSALDTCTLTGSCGYGPVKLFEIPPMPVAPISGDTWIPITVSASHGGTTSARVKFGYTPGFYCQGQPLSDTVWSGRHEVCMAVAATVQSTPYYFASETYTPLPCSSGCTLAVPAVPQRATYYQVEYLDGGGSVIATDPVGVAVVGTSPYLPWSAPSNPTRLVGGSKLGGRANTR